MMHNDKQIIERYERDNNAITNINYYWTRGGSYKEQMTYEQYLDLWALLGFYRFDIIKQGNFELLIFSREKYWMILSMKNEHLSRHISFTDYSRYAYGMDKHKSPHRCIKNIFFSGAKIDKSFNKYFDNSKKSCKGIIYTDHMLEKLWHYTDKWCNDDNYMPEFSTFYNSTFIDYDPPVEAKPSCNSQGTDSTHRRYKFYEKYDYDNEVC